MNISLQSPQAIRLTALPPLSVYAHLPWCVRKCPYCDFNSHERGGELPEAAYVDALLADLESLLPEVWGRRARSVFIGGGTPSLFSPGAVDRLLCGIRARLPLAPDAEITLEANPGTAEAGRFRGYRGAGVNRLSLGVQSFCDAHLRALGRIHDAAEARCALDMALRCFDNVNVDLMYGLPGQTLKEACTDVREAIAAGAPHVSAYQLAIEPNTAFFRHSPELPPHDLCADMQDAIEAALGAAGFEHYEISAFARAGRRCGHNLNYWEFGDYLGLGAGAHGKISFSDRVTRHERVKQPDHYLSSRPNFQEREVEAKELPFEFMLNALRLVEGFPSELFSLRSGLPLLSIEKQLLDAERKDLLERDWRRIRPTARGRRFLNELLGLFLGGESEGRARNARA